MTSQKLNLCCEIKGGLGLPGEKTIKYVHLPKVSLFIFKLVRASVSSRLPLTRVLFTCTFHVNGGLAGRLSTFMLQYDPDLSYKDL